MSDTLSGAARSEPSGNHGVFVWPGVRVGVLCNGVAGQGSDAADRARRVLDAMRAHGADCPDADGLPETIPAQMDLIREQKPGAVLAVGGDGTVNAGARVSLDCGAVLLVVPTGTMNLVAKDLGIPLTFEKQLADLTRLRELTIDAAAVNGEVFLHSSALGFVPEMARRREALRKSDGPGEWVRNAARFVGGLGAVGSRAIAMRSDRGTATRRTRSLLVSCNEIADGGPGEHRRVALDAGTLGVYASKHDGPFAWAGLCWSLAFGGLRRDPGTDRAVCGALDVETGTRVARVSNDGELATLETPLEFRVLARALRVLVPPAE